MIYKAVYIDSERYKTILRNFLNVTRTKKSNYKFNIYEKNNEYYLSHQFDLPNDFKLVTENTIIRVILNKDKLNILYATSARKKISQEFNLIN